MLVISAILFVLGVLPVYVAGQLVIQARCLAGYEWVRRFDSNLLSKDRAKPNSRHTTGRIRVLVMSLVHLLLSVRQVVVSACSCPSSAFLSSCRVSRIHCTGSTNRISLRWTNCSSSRCMQMQLGCLLDDQRLRILPGSQLSHVNTCHHVPLAVTLITFLFQLVCLCY
jgi:hypothetical protein